MKTKQTEHTPGPWKCYNASNGRIYKQWKVGGKTDRIADICDLGSSEATAANAQLIAAAPELFEALEWITRCAKMVGPRGINFYAIADDRMEAARAAIAKAKGQQ